ncbi:hypothetical protein TNCV_4309061 [Trichonephila clavipes]|nr:hypothetical protein TNCV_4309061 [Trichonephila clavipes]
MPSTSSSVSTVSTSSSSTQENLPPSPSAIIPTIQSETLLKIPIPTTTITTSPGNNLNTLVSPLETETRSHTTSDKLNSLSTENLPKSVPNTSNSEHSNAPEIPQSKKAAPTEITTDDEDMITYDVQVEELEQDPPDKFTIDEDPLNFPKGYLRSLTPSRYRNSRE